MRIPFRRSETDKRAAAARADLDAARAQLTAIDAEETAALGDGAAYAKVRERRAAFVAEIERLERLIAALEAGAEAARAHDEAEAMRKRREAANKRAADLLQRVRVDGPRIAAELLQLAVDCAQQEIEAAALNANLPVGETPIPVADIAARDFGTEPRQVISTREVLLWVNEATGVAIGDQSAVSTEDGVRGHVHVGASMRWRCVKRPFKEVTFHPRTLSDWPGSFYQLLRLPRLDAPGTLFDGSVMTVEAVAALDVAAVTKPAKRRPRAVQKETIPVGTWPPAGTAPDDAGRDAA